MRIGEFAKMCNTKISVLRHYDKLGLLKPVYIDRFTEYRYYDKSQTTAITMRKLDSNKYTKDEIARKDDINKPFVPDEQILGKWKAFCYFDPIEYAKEDFVPYENPPRGSWNYSNFYFKEIEFTEGGHCSSVYGDELITGNDMQVWTKGYVLRKWNSCACAYEIKIFDGKEYLIIEWKSGDYRWGGRATSYYVMVRD